MAAERRAVADDVHKVDADRHADVRVTARPQADAEQRLARVAAIIERDREAQLAKEAA